MLKKIGWLCVAVLLVSATSVRAQVPAATAANFDAFARAYFTAAAEPDMWKTFGPAFKFVDGGAWKHVSRSSATIAFETNLPARSYVLYGLVPGGYGYSTPMTTRGTFIHVHSIRFLLPNTTYYYRTIAIDERGLVAQSEEMCFTTQPTPRAIEVPGTLQGPPYNLDKPNAVYLVTRDIVADATALNVTADGVLLDLGGNWIIYNQKSGAADPGNSTRLYGPQGAEGPCGIRTADGLKNVKIVNGTVFQGAAMGHSRYNGFFPVFLRKPSDLELAGVKVVYAGAQVTGIKVNNGGDGLNIHHNVIEDQGTVLFNRHLGVKGIEFDTSVDAVKESKAHHNLILRTRHCGIEANANQKIESNEIYIDSYATNSYGVLYTSLKEQKSNLLIANNKIFGTGFHPIGLGAGEGWSDVQVVGNFILMQGTTFQWRWAGGEGGGDADAADKSGTFPVNGIRLQMPRGNVRYNENVVIVKGFGLGCNMRGLWLQPDSQAPSTVTLVNNRIKVLALDGLANGSAIIAAGRLGQAAKPHVMLEGNVIESDVCNVQFGDHMGYGGPYSFVRNTFVESWPDPRYKTLRLGWRDAKWESYGHEFVDNKLENGASLAKVAFDGMAGKRYDFVAAWTLTVQTDPGAKVTIKNNAGKVVASGTTDTKGAFAEVVVQGTFAANGNVMQTPHTVEVEKGAKKAQATVTVDGMKTVAIGL